jgi:hypothetical protein
MFVQRLYFVWSMLVKNKAHAMSLFIMVSRTIIRGTPKTPNSQLVTSISIKLQRPDGCD